MNILLIVDGALAILREILPELEYMVHKGDITIEEQQKRLKQVEALRAGEFDGPVWQIEK